MGQFFAILCGHLLWTAPYCFPFLFLLSISLYDLNEAIPSKPERLILSTFARLTDDQL